MSDQNFLNHQNQSPHKNQQLLKPNGSNETFQAPEIESLVDEIDEVLKLEVNEEERRSSCGCW